jgi:hypothetical protein
VRVRAGDDEEVEQLVAVPDEVEPAGRPPLGHARRVHGDAEPVERAHERLVRRRGHGAGGRPAVQHELVRDGHHPGRAHAREECGAERAELRRLERRHQRHRRGGGAQRRDGAHVQAPQGGGAEEGVVGQRVEGGDDQGRDAGVVQAERHVRRALRVAQDQVARAARQQAQHRAAEVREQRPPRDGLGGGERVRGRTSSFLLQAHPSLMITSRVQMQFLSGLLR